MGMILVTASVAVFVWAVVGLIRPTWARLPSRAASVGVWVLSVVLFIIGGALMPDSTPEQTEQSAAWAPARPTPPPPPRDSAPGAADGAPANNVTAAPSGSPASGNLTAAQRNAVRSANSYLWLTYRMFNLTRPLRLTWPLLYRQFGVDPAKATDKFTVRDFRADCLRELKKSKTRGRICTITRLHGRSVLSPSPPLIAPSQLRRAEAEITDV